LPDVLFEVEVIADEDGDQKVYTVAVEAEDATRAVQKAKAEIGLALALLNPVYKVVSATAKRKDIS
jgi:hypothetical protein